MSLKSEGISNEYYQNKCFPYAEYYKSNYTKINDNFHIMVTNKIGKGAYGKVYSVTRLEDGKEYAMKVLNVSESIRKKFADWEISIGRTIHSKGLTNYLMGVYCSAIIRDQVYFIMDKLELDLWKLMSKHYNNSPFNLLQIRNVAWQLLTAVETLNSLGIIHTDIKPENVLVTSIGSNNAIKIKIADYGTALRIGHYTCSPKIQSLFYRSPEILFGLPFDEKIDIWSIGCMMMEMYLGFPFYPAVDELQLAHFITTVQGYPYDLDQGKFWPNYFTRQCTWYPNGRRHLNYFLKPLPDKIKDSRPYKFSTLSSVLEHGFTLRACRYISVLDIQFIRDLALLMNIDRDSRCSAEEAKSLALFQMDPSAINEEYLSPSSSSTDSIMTMSPS